MTKNNFFTRFTSIYTDKTINPYIRAGAWIATAIVMYYVGKFGYNKLFPNPAQKKAKDDLIQRENELKAALQNQRLSYPISQYNTWADTIAESMKGCDYLSTSASTIYNIFNQLNNNADYLQLYKSFGIRTISKHAWCGGDYENLDMAQCIGHQLTDQELDGGLISKGINDVLKSKGITYRITSI